MICHRKTLSTPVGKLFLAASDMHVLGLSWDPEDMPRRQSQREWEWEFSRPGASCPLLEKAESQLREYFQGQRRRFRLPLQLRGTPFQEKVWSGLGEIPYGETWSYRDLAESIGHPGAVRAVGTANGRNPLCILIPCHRVVRHSGELGGYAGGVENKARLLSLERGLE
jgi:methylated-DNA-[protein]-cysteine S-methyltransferase